MLTVFSGISVSVVSIVGFLFKVLFILPDWHCAICIFICRHLHCFYVNLNLTYLDVLCSIILLNGYCLLVRNLYPIRSCLLMLSNSFLKIKLLDSHP